MPDPAALDTIDAIRVVSRNLVRELGFTGGRFAGTDLSPSSVHALIEIEPGNVTARDISQRLHLEKSSVSRMLRKLIDAGDVAETAGKDARTKMLCLTAGGRRRVAAIHAFARDQVSCALARLEPGQEQTVLDGLGLYARALSPKAAASEQAPDTEIVEGYQTGLIARITQMHACYYAQVSGFGQPFESVVAGGLAEFCDRLQSPRNAIWAVMQQGRILGSIAIDGEDMPGNVAHLRWFIVDDRVRGTGAGRRLLSAALDFTDRQGFAETHLSTFSGLDAARHLYEMYGFVLHDERPGTQWGAEVLEQRFVRPFAGIAEPGANRP